MMGGMAEGVATPRHMLSLAGSRRAYRLKMRKRNARREGLGGSEVPGVVDLRTWTLASAIWRARGIRGKVILLLRRAPRR